MQWQHTNKSCHVLINVDYNAIDDTKTRISVVDNDVTSRHVIRRGHFTTVGCADGLVPTNALCLVWCVTN